MAVGGDSAGKAQVLVYPATHHGTVSYQENGGGEFGLSEVSMPGFGITTFRLRWFRRCEDVSGLPPALVITAEYDPLRDEAHDYADRLTEAGVRVERTLYLGVVHGFLGQAALVPEGRQAIEEIAVFLKSIF